MVGRPCCGACGGKTGGETPLRCGLCGETGAETLWSGDLVGILRAGAARS